MSCFRSFAYVVFIVLLLVQCKTNDSVKGEMPDWFQSPPRSDSKVYFLGFYEYKKEKSSEGLEIAKKNALAQVASYIITQIDSTIEVKSLSIEKDGVETASEYIKSDLKATSNAEIYGVEFSKLVEDKRGKKWYVLAEIPKNKIEEMIERNLDPIGFEVRKVFTQMNKKYPRIKSLTISNFNYKGKHYSGEISGYFRSKIQSSFIKLGFLKEYNDPEFNKYLDQSGLTTRGVTIEKNEETDSLYSKVQGFVSGSYWDSADNIEFEIKVYDMNEKNFVYSDMFYVKKSIFKNIKIKPDNVDDFSKKYSEISNLFENQTFNIKIWPDKGDYSTYKQGEYLVPHFTSNKDCYLRVYLVSADGNAVLLFPNFYDKNNFIKKNQVYKIGDPKFSPFKLKLSPPYGSEMLVAIASTVDFKNDFDYENDVPVIEGDALRGVILESVKGITKEQVTQTSCVYTIVPADNY